MSNLLQKVRKALQENPNINIVRVFERNYLPGRSGYWSHNIGFYVAPKTGEIYIAEQFQKFTMSLVSGLEPTHKDIFCKLGCEIWFGKLYFDEDIGAEAVRREITLTDEDMFSLDGFVEGKRVIECTNKLWRRTQVVLFASVQIATAALEVMDGECYLPC